MTRADPAPSVPSSATSHPAVPIRTNVTSSKGGGHQHTLSTSPRSNPALSDPDYWPDRDGEDDVFSNPDTAELEARSDATGATSPDRAMSPIVGSPDFRSSGPLARRLRDAESEEDKRQPQPSETAPTASLGIGVSPSATAALHHQSSRGSHLTESTTAVAQDRSNDTPTPSTLNVHTARPLSSSPSTPNPASDYALPFPAANELPQDPNEANHISSLFVHPPAPPSAFASHGSPAAGSVRLALSGGGSHMGSPIASTTASAAGSPLSERSGFQWSTTMPTTSSSSSSAMPVRPVSKTAAARPHSPDRQRTIMPSIADATDAQPPGRSHRASSSIASAAHSPTTPAASGGRQDPGLGLGFSSQGSANIAGVHSAASPSPGAHSPPAGSRVISAHSLAPSSDAGASAAATESSIFERDIEHRDARHVLSKSEAVDVAIPPVLDDAVEAIIESSDASFEIVEPIQAASPAPAALSAMALTVHSLASSSQAHGASPITESSPPMSHTGPVLPSPVESPPPGSIAAQIAEKLSPARPLDDGLASTHQPDGISRHRATHSSSASSVSSSMRSRSVGNAATIGVQQVLDGSGILSGSSAGPGSPARASQPRDGPFGAASQVGRGYPSSNASTTPSRPASQHFGTALPSLPLPNPFRSDGASVLRHSPSASMSSSSEAQGPAGPMSMSLDGAVIPSAESAIRELSLDGMADALAESSGVDANERADMPSPILPRRSPNPASSTTSHFGSSPASASGPFALSIFGRRDTDATITPASTASDPLKGANMLPDVTENIPGGLPADDTSSRISATHSRGTSASSPSARRLSFFSYADIINETPAEVIDLESAIQKKTAEDVTATVKASGGPSTHRPILSSVADVFNPASGGSKQLSPKSAGTTSSRAGQESSPELKSNRYTGSAAAVTMARSASAGPSSKSVK